LPPQALGAGGADAHTPADATANTIEITHPRTTAVVRMRCSWRAVRVNPAAKDKRLG
jgi:hypothetical protein